MPDTSRVNLDFLGHPPKMTKEERMAIAVDFVRDAVRLHDPTGRVNKSPVQRRCVPNPKLCCMCVHTYVVSVFAVCDV